MVGLDVVAAIHEFFVSGKLLKARSITSVTLIPKIQYPNTLLGDFRSIPSCHVLYKCISKLLCSKLKLVPNVLIDNAQGAFVANRSIIHNVLLCQDIVKHYGRNQCTPSCLLKIDLRKAYETMD